MKATFALLAFATSIAAQAVTELVVPSATPPAGCDNSRSGTFQITVVNVSNPDASSAASPVPSSTFARRWDARPVIAPFPLLPRQNSGILTLTLTGGLLTDQANRTGYIASNYQFQFDGPPQSGAIYTGGFSLCANGTLALGGSAIFYQCLSGTFYNLYDRNFAPVHCVAVYIEAIGGSGSVFSTVPPVPASTGPSEATISNGGGTMTTKSTGVGIGGPTSTSRRTGTGSGSATATASGSESGESGASAAATSSSSGVAVPTGMERAQRFLGWALGVVGVVVVV